MKRSQTAIVELKIRLREPLRARLERAAKARGVSMNAEMVGRLERSLDRQDLLAEVLTLAPAIRDAIAKAEGRS